MAGNRRKILSIFSSFKKPKISHLEYQLTALQDGIEIIFTNKDEPYLRNLCKEFELDQLVQGCTKDYEKILTVTNWVHRLWKHSSSNTPSKAEPITILREVKTGQQFRCVEYSIVLTGCLNSLGITTRVVFLKSKAVETQITGAGHVITEAFVKELDKWILIDPQWNVIPNLNGTPLNAVELQKAIVDKQDVVFDTLSKTKDQNRYPQWIGEYLYFMDISLGNRYDTKNEQRFMLVPLGVKPPKVFQRKFPIHNMTFTNSIRDFYPKMSKIK